ncbi:MAG: AI-2E family transporter [Candidatus Pacebacteria bacterium]|nr:AI-2E family transporter [Candidatus Paceibacterota bacterium]
MLKFLKPKHEVSVSPSTIIFSVFFLLTLYFLFYIHSILILLFLAFIVMVALNPAVTKLETRFKLSRLVSIILVYSLFLIVIFTLIAFLIPPLINQLYQLLKTINLPILQEEIRNFKLTLTNISNLVAKWGTSVNAVFSLIRTTFNSVFTFFTFLVMSFYLLLDRPHLYKKIAWFSKKKAHFKLSEKIIDDLELQLGGWVRGQIILMTLIGIIIFIGLTLLSVPYALPLALMAGMLEILPNLGPTLAAVPALVITYFAAGPIMTGVVALFYIIVQQLENNLIVPKVMKDNANVNPLVSITAILIGFEVYGVIGALLALPSYIVLRTLYSYWLRFSK